MSTATIDPHSIASIVRQVIAEIGQPSAAAAPVAGPVAGGVTRRCQRRFLQR